MTKSQFVDGTCCGWTDFFDIDDGSGSKAFSIQPAVMIGATNADGEFLIAARGGGGSDSIYEVYHITNPQEDAKLAQAARSVGSYSIPPSAAQPGGALAIDTGDTRLLYAFWQNGKLASGQTFACGNPAVACVAFEEFDVWDFPTIRTLNDWSLGAGYYPMVAANSFGNRTMVYNRSSATEFAGAFFVGIPPTTSCTRCFDGPETTLAAGLTTYVLRNCPRPPPLPMPNCPGPLNRWGDYSGASPDPDGTGIWIRGEYASATQNQWATVIGLTQGVTPPPPPPPPVAEGVHILFAKLLTSNFIAERPVGRGSLSIQATCSTPGATLNVTVPGCPISNQPMMRIDETQTYSFLAILTTLACFGTVGNTVTVSGSCGTVTAEIQRY
jgi:hypothetical protein